MKTTISCQNLWVGWCLRTASTHSTLWQFTHQFVCMYHTCNLQSHCHTLQTSWLNTDCGHSYTNSTAYNVHSMVCMLMCPLFVGWSKTTTEIRHMQVTYVRTYIRTLLCRPAWCHHMQGTNCESEAMCCSDKTIHSYNQQNQYIWEV